MSASRRLATVCEDVKSGLKPAILYCSPSERMHAPGSTQYPHPHSLPLSRSVTAPSNWGSLVRMIWLSVTVPPVMLCRLVSTCDVVLAIPASSSPLCLPLCLSLSLSVSLSFSVSLSLFLSLSLSFSLCLSIFLCLSISVSVSVSRSLSLSLSLSLYLSISLSLHLSA